MAGATAEVSAGGGVESSASTWMGRIADDSNEKSTAMDTMVSFIVCFIVCLLPSLRKAAGRWEVPRSITSA